MFGELVYWMTKTFYLSSDQIKRLTPGRGRCLATDMITVEGHKVGYMYRSEPRDGSDSGWVFMAGNETQDDTVIMAWALANAHVVFTHDLDFGTVLALTHANGPSVFQVRGQNVLPEDIGPIVIAACVNTMPRWQREL